ncbi:orotidine-5'-phosphate decarboxylase [Candidatus Micrarchaeota archaeon]|nr:orotidine-5'-phosphate decarboxylase [Candidatus Micrarchaeota archaeon]
MSFHEKYANAREKKNSVLCVGLDPVSIFFKDTGSIPRKYFEKKDEVQGMADFCLDLVDQTKSHACAYKINAQFALPFSIRQLNEITARVSQTGAISIFDLKLSDIGSSNESAIYWMKKAGFDAFTYSPFPGNLSEVTQQAHAMDLGVIALALMSHPDARYFMTESQVERQKGFEWIAESSARNGIDGLVVGATNPPELIEACKAKAAPQTVFLVPGVGTQEGNAQTVLKILGENVLVNVGRSLIYSEDPQEKAEAYQRKFNEWRQQAKE